MKVNFVVRRTKKNSDGYVPIEMTICVKGKRQYVSTGRSVMPSKFSPKTVQGRNHYRISYFQIGHHVKSKLKPGTSIELSHKIRNFVPGR